jgi:formate hydrogenlyase subunit 6/NADH:ubiquinone oxidoreductase subunit I
MAYRITENCVGCTLCAKSCPVKAITGKLRERHVIDPGRCVSCGLCGRVCAKGAVEAPDGSSCSFVPKKLWKKPRVDTIVCAGCSLCIENCPENCLELSKPHFRGDIHTFAKLARPDDCIGCGICARSCPVAAIDMWEVRT